MKQIHRKHLSSEEIKWLSYIQTVVVGKHSGSKKD